MLVTLSNSLLPKSPRYDWIYEFVNDNRYRLEDEYFEYRKENYFLEDYDYINDCYNEYKDDDDTCSDISYNNYSFTSCDKSCMNDELEELIKNSFLYIYSRKLIEIVEKYNLNMIRRNY